MEKEKLYLVISSSGEYDYYNEFIIFATKNKDYAEKYVKRLNSLVERTREYLLQYTRTSISGLHFIEEKYWDSWQYSRWQQVHDLNEAFIRETELR